MMYSGVRRSRTLIDLSKVNRRGSVLRLRSPHERLAAKLKSKTCWSLPLLHMGLSQMKRSRVHLTPAI